MIISCDYFIFYNASYLFAYYMITETIWFTLNYCILIWKVLNWCKCTSTTMTLPVLPQSQTLQTSSKYQILSQVI